MKKLLYDRLLVKPIIEKNNNGLIIIPDSVKQKITKAEVISVGDGIDEDNNYFIGKKIIFQDGFGVKVEEDGCEYLILRKSDVLAIV